MEISWEGFQKIGKFPKGETLNGKFRGKRSQMERKFPLFPVFLTRLSSSLKITEYTVPFNTENFPKLKPFFLSNKKRYPERNAVSFASGNFWSDGKRPFPLLVYMCISTTFT